VQPRMSARAEPSFTALRARVLDEIGFDFLGTISEALRPVDFASDESDYLSWHKTGRAIDTLFELGWRGQYKMLEVVREDWHGDVYWRLWLRCRVQDGTCGEPLVDAAWDYTYDARWTRAPGEGGHPKPFQTGYYVDFTTLAEDEGWDRIPSYEAPDFDWRSNTVGMEYWHYQITHGLTWYESVREVYSPATIEQWFGWEQLVEHEIPRWLLKAKGVPLPPDVRHVPAEMIIP
jgi:TolB protein